MELKIDFFLNSITSFCIPFVFAHFAVLESYSAGKWKPNEILKLTRHCNI